MFYIEIDDYLTNMDSALDPNICVIKGLWCTVFKNSQWKVFKNSTADAIYSEI